MTDIEAPDMFAEIQANLEKIGYEGDLIQRDYAFRDFLSTSKTTGSTVRRVPLAAFAQWPPSYRNACIGVAAPSDASADAIKPFCALGAPQVLALHPAERLIRRWKINAAGDPTPLEPFHFSEITSTFQRYKQEWGPQRILDARTLAPTEATVQLDFFDSGLLPALESMLRIRLERDIQRVMQRCKNTYAQEYPDLLFDDNLAPVFRLVFRFIAAKMLIDRGNKPQWDKLGAPDVIAAVDAFYFGTEIPEPVLQNKAVQEAVWQQVRSGLDLQNLSVETLAYLYENAFVTEELRRDQSIHATPLEVAEYLIRQLPIDKLKYNERRVFEPFTGHAPFLTAALRRLRELLPKDISPQERHAYFVQMLSGMENEPFAREIARYALILADYPNPDGWRISDANVFTSPEFDNLLMNAKIVLCNPPFGKFTMTERSTLGAGTAYSKEVEALRRVLAHRPAMLGFVLPRSFLDKKAFALLRQEIVTQYRSMSITVLPEKTFNKASQEVACITAHNVDLPSAPYSYATVSSAGYEGFQRTGEPTWKYSYNTLLWRNEDVVLARTPLQAVWEALDQYAIFQSLAEIHEAIRYKTDLLKQCVSDEMQAGFTPGVRIVEGYMEAFLIRNYQYLCTEPEAMRDQAYRQPWERPKVIVNRGRRSRNYWHIAGAVDQQGLWALRQFYGVWPKDKTPVELLAAIISGPVANAFLLNYPALRYNQIRWIEQIPVPSFTKDQTELIVSLVQDYYSQRGQWLATEHLSEHFEARCRKLLYQIDAAVLEAYDLPAELERELLRAFNGAPRRPLPFEFLGYGEEYEHAKAELQKEKSYRAVLSRYHELVNKEFLDGITEAESKEQEQLRRQLDVYDAPFYEPMISALETERQ